VIGAKLRQFVFDEPSYFFFGQTESSQALDGRFDQVLCFSGGFAGRGGSGDESAGAVPQLDHGGIFQFAVSAGYCVGVRDQIGRQPADGGKLTACLEGAGLDGMFYLLHQLEVDGDAGGWVEAEQRIHCIS